MGGSIYGLGQFNNYTWHDAVKEYNDNYRSPSESRIYPEVSKDDPDTQIKVMGAWIRKAWEKAQDIADDPKLKDYSLLEVAYGLWHAGIYKSVDGVKAYLDDADKGYKNKTAQIDFYLNDTYVKAHDALDIRNILSPMQFRGSGSSSGETLSRDIGDYRKVWRIEPDGGTRGYFISE